CWKPIRCRFGGGTTRIDCSWRPAPRIAAGRKLCRGMPRGNERCRKVIPMPRPRRIEGYAIVSEDGMLANFAGIMPESLKFEADQQFFERGLDGVDVVVHGRHSYERQPC